MNDYTQLSLVVVPRSHLEYSAVKEQLEKKQSSKTIIPTIHSVKLRETWSSDSPEFIKYRNRAKQLDLLSECQGKSCIVIWNSKLIHQGSASVKKGTPIKEGAFIPPLLTPRIFLVDDVEAWRTHLSKEGYVVLGDVLGDNMDSYLKYLLNDINNINPEAKLRTLNEVQEKHLGLERRGLRYTLGFPHGQFAWAIRENITIHNVWKNLFQCQEIMGAIDVPALTCTDSSTVVADKNSHDEWLHWDQNALLEPVGKQEMFQSMVYLFPDENGKFGGNIWTRIALAICMCPRAYGRSVQSEKKLLALAITGEASNHWPQIVLNVNYAWNGMRTEEMKKKFPHLNSEDIEAMFSDRFISTQQMQKNGWKRFLAKLNPNLTTDDLHKFAIKLNIGNYSQMSKEEIKERLCLIKYQVLIDNLSLDDLRQIVNPCVKSYVCFVAN